MRRGLLGDGEFQAFEDGRLGAFGYAVVFDIGLSALTLESELTAGRLRLLSRLAACWSMAVEVAATACLSSPRAGGLGGGVRGVAGRRKCY
jgi:cobalamin synthase